MSKNEETDTPARVQMPALDAEAIQAVVRNYRERSDRMGAKDVTGLTLKLELLRRSEKAALVLEQKFPGFSGPTTRSGNPVLSMDAGGGAAAAGAPSVAV